MPIQLFSLLFLFATVSYGLGAQPTYFNYNHTYVPHIRTVQFGVAGYQHTFPLIELGSAGQLELTFDDIDGDVKSYVFQIIHCDIDWQPSNLSPLEYIDGFAEDDILQVRFSFRTLSNYAHYNLVFPNQTLQFTKSGNYLLVVYDNEYEKIPVITRRFLVVDRQVGVSAQIKRPAAVSKIHTHQEIDFAIDLQRLTVRAPLQEIRAVVLQNMRWDNAITDLAPNFLRPANLSFDYSDRVVFPAGNEFRNLDLRTLRTPPRYVTGINSSDLGVDFTLAADRRRNGQAYFSFNDFNGDFIIENFDQPDAELSGEYVNVLFQLGVEEPFYDDDVYLFGAFSEWQLKPEYQLVYNPAVNAYVGKAQLKQGFYNFAYALAPRNPPRGQKPQPDWSLVEGNFSDTENGYHILVYYRPVGGRYDQLIGAFGTNSWRQN